MRLLASSVLAVVLALACHTRAGMADPPAPGDPPKPESPKPDDPPKPAEPEKPGTPADPAKRADPVKPGPADPDPNAPLAPVEPVKPAEPPRVVHDAQAVQVMVGRYGEAKHWALKAIILLALGREWHPAGAAMIAQGLADRDPRVRVYALEVLRRSHADTLRAAVDPELLGALVTRHLRDGHAEYRKEVLAILAQLVPAAGCTTEAEWTRWYAKTGKKSYAPLPWPAPPRDGAQGSVEVPLVDRAFDVSQAGLELVIAIDTTGSMQTAIDATSEAMRDLVAVLGGFSPKFRAGLVLYNDPGAKVDSPLDVRTQVVHERLDKVRANGGGDFPEAVTRGLELAFDVGTIGWQRATHKFVLVVGDAPPHDKDLADALDRVRKARASGGGEADAEPVLSGGARKAKDPARGVITSAIGIGAPPAPQTVDAFKQIALAGGGIYEAFSPADKRTAAGALMTLMVRLSFGEQFAREATALAEIFQRWREAGYVSR